MQAALESWLAEIRSVRLEREGVARTIAAQNSLAFSLSTAQAGKIASDEVDRFLEAAYSEYAARLGSSAIGFWFYVWNDEMSGTLRVSAAPARRPEELPFACGLIITESPTPVSAAFLKSAYLDGIPRAELEQVAWEDPDVDDSQPALTVFARRIPLCQPAE